MSNPLDLTISIVSYNTKDLIRTCIHSIIEHTKGISYRIIIVDNASKDGTAEMIESDFPEVQLIRSPKNLGFAAGNNLALEKADSRYFVLFNSDTELINDAFTELVNFMDKHPECGIASPQLFSPNGNTQISYYPFRNPKKRAYRELYPRLRELKYVLGLKEPSKHEKEIIIIPEKPIEVERPRGVCFMVRMDCIHEIGPMDGNYFIFADEVDWAWRAKKAGWKRFLVPSAKVYHQDHASVSQHATLMVKVQMQSVYYFNYKHHGLKAWLRLRIGYLLSALMAFFLFVLTSLIGKGKSLKTPKDHLSESKVLFILTFLTKKVLPPDAV